MQANYFWIKLLRLPLLMLLLYITFNDLGYSEMVYNPSHYIAVFVRNYAYIPTYFLMVIALSIVYKGFKIKFPKLLFLWHGIYAIGLVAFVGVFMEKSMEYFTYPVGSIVIMFALFIVAGHWIASIIPSSKRYETMQIAFSALVAYGVTFVVIYFSKLFIGRVRPFMVYDEGEAFMPWYLPGGLNLDDAYQALPSGHTGFAVLMLFIVLIPKVFGKKMLTIPLYINSIIWILFVAYGRVMGGAHFISDTIVTSILVLIIMQVTIAFVPLMLDQLFDRKEGSHE